jgi:hypothetical protein
MASATPSTSTAGPLALAHLWPVPALLAWAGAWAVFHLLGAAAVPPWLAGVLAASLGVVAALLVQRPWRRALVALGFPLSAVASGVSAGIPAWTWLLPLALLWLLYPLRAWRDAPLFPTSAKALQGLDALITLPVGARILEAGCGLGHGMRALRAVWPKSHIDGVEHSALLACIARWRCRRSTVQRGDMWATSWAGYDMVYLFQRPESMPRAWEKARAEMAPGAYLASLEFEVPGMAPTARLENAGQRPVRLYRVGGKNGPVPT